MHDWIPFAMVGASLATACVPNAVAIRVDDEQLGHCGPFKATHFRITLDGEASLEEVGRLPRKAKFASEEARALFKTMSRRHVLRELSRTNCDLASNGFIGGVTVELADGSRVDHNGLCEVGDADAALNEVAVVAGHFIERLRRIPPPPGECDPKECPPLGCFEDLGFVGRGDAGNAHPTCLAEEGIRTGRCLAQPGASCAWEVLECSQGRAR